MLPSLAETPTPVREIYVLLGPADRSGSVIVTRTVTDAWTVCCCGSSSKPAPDSAAVSKLMAAARIITGPPPPRPSSAISTSRSTWAPTAAAYSRARASASAMASRRTSAPARLPGRSCHHGPDTVANSSPASRSISGPSVSKSVTVTVVPTLPLYATTRSLPRLSSGKTCTPLDSLFWPARISFISAARSSSRLTTVSRSRSRADTVTEKTACSGGTSRSASPRTTIVGCSLMGRTLSEVGHAGRLAQQPLQLGRPVGGAAHGLVDAVGETAQTARVRGQAARRGPVGLDGGLHELAGQVGSEMTQVRRVRHVARPGAALGQRPADGGVPLGGQRGV